jgi:hypothetical protein
MLSILLGLIPGLLGTVNGITNAITNEKINLAQSQTEADRIASQQRIASLQAKRDVLIAESGTSKINAIIRGAIGGGVAVVLGKLLVWDKVVGSFYGCAGSAGQAIECATFRTDPFDASQWNVVMAAIGFYFVYEGAVNATRIWKS